MVFLILMFIGIVILFAQIGLPNSYVPDSSISLKPKPILLNFATVLKEQFLYAFGIYCLFGTVYLCSSFPILFMDIFKVDAKTYGWIFAFMSISFIIKPA
jgi:DHA1 family bicyclomycin/chloramphenicol resistance-like MFS transporter